MASTGPSILILADDVSEGALIASALSDAGFATVAACDRASAVVALKRQQFAAAVIAAPEPSRVAFLRRARLAQADLPALAVVDPTIGLGDDDDDDDDADTITRPVDPRELIDGVLKLVLHEEPAAPRHNRAAEIGIAAAKLACLCRRHTTAATTGATRLAHDLSRQIGDMRAALARSGAGGGAAQILAAGD